MWVYDLYTIISGVCILDKIVGILSKFAVTDRDSDDDGYKMRSSRNKKVSYVDKPGDSDEAAENGEVEPAKAKPKANKKRRLVMESDSDYMPGDDDDCNDGDHESKAQSKSNVNSNNVDKVIAKVDRNRRMLSESECSDADSCASTGAKRITDSVSASETKCVRKIISDSDSES